MYLFSGNIWHVFFYRKHNKHKFISRKYFTRVRVLCITPTSLLSFDRIWTDIISATNLLHCDCYHTVSPLIGIGNSKFGIELSKAQEQHLIRKYFAYTASKVEIWGNQFGSKARRNFCMPRINGYGLWLWEQGVSMTFDLPYELFKVLSLDLPTNPLKWLCPPDKH